MSIAEANAHNKSKQKFSSQHESQSYASRRAKRASENPGHEYPSLIDDFEEMHTDKNTHQWTSKYVHSLHEKMLNLKTQSPSGTSEEEILEEVLGSRSGHNRGRGRKLSNAITGVMPSSSSRNKGKGKMQKENMVNVNDFARYMQQIQAANPGFVLPQFPFPSNNQNEENSEDGEEDGEDDE